MDIPSLRFLIPDALLIDVVDVGSNPIDGDPPYKRFLAEGIARVIGFDPNPEAISRLQNLKGPHETYLPLVVADGQPHRLFVCASEGMTSILEPNFDVLDLFNGYSDWARVRSVETVNTVRLDDVPHIQNVDLLKLDIQGAELLALKNASRCLSSAVAIHTEVEFLPMYRNQPQFSEVELFLRQQGFVLHKFVPLAARTIRPLSVPSSTNQLIGQLLWADALFIRDPTRLHVLSRDKLLKLALIVHDLYNSHDMAAHILGAIPGSDLRDRLLQALIGPAPGGEQNDTA